MAPYTDFEGLRRAVGEGLRSGRFIGEPARTPVTGSLNLTERHPWVQAIGFSEGNLDIKGRPTASYAGHSDPGNRAANVGIFSAQNSGSTPEAANRVWLQKLNSLAPKFDEQVRQAGATPGTPVYDLVMASLLDLYVQAPAAVMEAGGLLSRIPEMVRAKGSAAAIAKARADSFRTSSGALDAPGFGNSWSRLLADQRRRTSALKTRLSS
jgi:hypothetical protein